MKTNKILFFCFATIAGLILQGCGSEYEPHENGVYISEAQIGPSKKVSIDDKGGVTVFSARLAKPASVDTKVMFGIDNAALDAYNKRNGTAYVSLPENYFTFSATDAVIKAGQTGCDPVQVIIKPFDANISQNDKYAIPVTITSVEGDVNLMNDSKNVMLLVDQIIVTSVPYITGGNVFSYTAPELMSFPKWTFEWNVKHDAFNRNNVTQWNIFGADNAGAVIYMRFGDVTCPQDCFQVKIGNSKPQSGTALTAGKWYHLALVYDGTNVMFYINGVQDFKSANAVPGEVFVVKRIEFANGANATYTLKGSVSELRVWSIARSAGEIANNMYTINPNTEGLEIYWKANEGTGKAIKDYSPYKRDINLKSVPTWYSGIRFPGE